MKRAWIWIAAALLIAGAAALALKGGLAPKGLPVDANQTELEIRDLASNVSKPFLKVPGQLQALALSPDGHQLATLSSPSAAKSKGAWILIWDFPRCNLLRRFDLAKAPTALAWGGSDLIVTSGKGVDVQVRSVSQGNLIRTLPNLHAPLAINPKEGWIAGQSNEGVNRGSVEARYLQSGQALFKTAVMPIPDESTLSWLGDGKLLALIDLKGVQSWSAPSGKAMGRISAAQLSGSSGSALTPADHAWAGWVNRSLESAYNLPHGSPDRRWLLRSGESSAFNSTLEVLDLAAPKVAAIVDTYASTAQVAITSDARTMILPSSPPEPGVAPLGQLILESGREKAEWQGHLGGVESVDLDPGGLWIASGGQDWLIKIWDAHSHRLIQTLEGHRAPLETVRISGDGTWIASREQKGTDLRIWEVSKGASVRRIPSPLNEGYSHFRFHPTRPWLLLPTPGGLKVFDASTGELFRTLPQRPASDRQIAFSADGSRMAMLDPTGVTILDSQTLEATAHLPSPVAPAPATQKEGEVEYQVTYAPFAAGLLAFSVDGSQLWWSAGWNDGGEESVWGALWDITKGSLIKSGPELESFSGPEADRFPMRRDPHVDQRSGTPDGKVRISGAGFEAGC
ncbi:MAG: hypothetical protein HYZ13_02620 [Acidobacteria bacterium]|nr:hypothetical protein [Acidobacteriota bacterium]